MAGKYWILAVVVLMTSGLGTAFMLDQRAVFLPGRTSDGHHTIELSCNSCHLGFAAVPNKNCAECHMNETREDTHPVKLFDDPRWADMLQKVNAVDCATCHREHEVAYRGVTIDKGFCYPCHDDVTTKRESHKNYAPQSCWDGGCHNYHDNTALNIAFLSKRMRGVEPPTGTLLERASSVPPGEAEPPDAPEGTKIPAGILSAWRGSDHAQRGVNCSDCHGKESFDDRPPASACARCHPFEVASLGRGKHGASEALKLPPLSPRDARRPMKAEALDRHLSCSSCHDSHSVNTRRAAAEACLGCHADRHSQSFRDSKHGQKLFRTTGARPSAAVVSCATCHMPRTRMNDEKDGRVVVNHNNSWTLMPRDRMVKQVCLGCHDLEFSISSIFDEALIENNFRGLPSKRHETLKLVEIESRGGISTTKRGD